MKIRLLILLFLIQALGVLSAVAKPKHGLRKFRPLELRGSKEQRVEQNIRANNLGLGRISTRVELVALAVGKVLVELTDSDHYYIDPEPEKICSPDVKGRYKTKFLKKRRIYVRPEVKRYLDSYTAKYFAQFHNKLKVTSGARSLEEQISMRSRKSPCFTGYAAEAGNALEESLHVRGVVVDISRRVLAKSGKRGKPRERYMSSKEIAWIREELIKGKRSKNVEAEEELAETQIKLEINPIEENICYHIVVFPSN